MNKCPVCKGRGGSPGIACGEDRCKDDRGLWSNANRILCEQYHGPPPVDPDGKRIVCRHLNHDLRLENLAWGTDDYREMIRLRETGMTCQVGCSVGYVSDICRGGAAAWETEDLWEEVGAD